MGIVGGSSELVDRSLSQRLQFFSLESLLIFKSTCVRNKNNRLCSKTCDINEIARKNMEKIYSEVKSEIFIKLTGYPEDNS